MPAAVKVSELVHNVVSLWGQTYSHHVILINQYFLSPIPYF